jgi:YHS domain-containing protein
MSVEVASAQWTSEYEGSTYYFCSQACFDRFTKEPATFATVGNPTPGPMQAEEGSAGE